MTRTNLDLDDDLVAEVMHRYGLPTKRAAVDLALRRLVGDRMERDEALAMEGTGWDADLQALRADPTPDHRVTLVDTSAWIEFLRATGSPIHHEVRDILAAGRPLQTTDAVVMEVLAGGRDEVHVAQLRRLLATCEFVAVEGLNDFEQAAAIYRRCRRAGDTVRALTDCLIASITIRAGLDLLHTDRDFDAIARHTTLELYNPPRTPT